MIRVNLRRGRGSLRKKGWISCYRGLVAGIVLVIVLSGWWWATLNSHYRDLTEERQRKLAALQEIENRVAEFGQLEQERKRLRMEFEALTAGQRIRTESPVVLLDALSREMEGLDLWLVRLSLTEAQVDVEGQALDSQSVKTFVDRLEQSSAVAALRAFTVTPMQDHKGKRYRFVLHLLIS